MDISKNKVAAKNKRWFQPDLGFVCEPAKKKSTYNQNSRSNFKTNSFNIEHNKFANSHQDVRDQNWNDTFKPVEIVDLAVNNKKVQEVQEWLSKSLNDPVCPNCMLLLSGPSGCGKTATLEVLCRKLGVTLSEWVTPIDIEHVRELGSNRYEYQEKQSDRFVDFLLKASRFRSLLSNQNSPRIILVEDFPNYLLKDPSEFVNVLQKYRDFGKSPIAFICTDSRDNGLNMMWNLFPPNVQEKFCIEHISLNSVSTTGMKQALKRIIGFISKNNNNSLKVPDQETIDSIINSSMGDIRSAVNNLYFASQKGNITLQVENKVTKVTKGKRDKNKDKKQCKLSSIGKDETLTIMHGVGRVLNPKLMEKQTAKDHQKFTHSPESLVDHFQMQPMSFLGYLHENYLPHFSNIHYVEKATDYLSDADCFMNEWREKFGKIYGLTVSISGLMVANKSPVSSWHPIKGPKKSNIIYPSIKEIPLMDRNQMISGKVLATDFKGFCTLIDDGTTHEDDDLIEDFVISE